MLKNLKRSSIVVAIIMAFMYFMPTYANAYYIESTENKINKLLDEIFEEREKGNNIDTQVKELEEIIATVNVSSSVIDSNKGISPRAFNRWVDLGKGWRYQVHRPHGSTATKYHVHVVGKVGKRTVEAKESLDGKSTHGNGNTMNDKGVPKDIQRKVKNDRNYKDAKNEERKAKNAKFQMNAKRLNLRKTAELVIGIGIFISVVGIALFAANAYYLWMPVLLAL